MIECSVICSLSKPLTDCFGYRGEDLVLVLFVVDANELHILEFEAPEHAISL